MQTQGRLGRSLLFRIIEFRLNMITISCQVTVITVDIELVLSTPEFLGRLSTSVQRFDFWDRLGN